jgi:hypothetical protein
MIACRNIFRFKQFTIEQYDALGSLSEEHKHSLLTIFNTIWASNYTGQAERVFDPFAKAIFRDDQIVYLAKENERNVGFFVRRNCYLPPYRIVHPRINAVVADLHNSQLTKVIRDIDLERERQLDPDSDRVVYLRTRNPLIWALTAKICTRVALDLPSGARDEELVNLGEDLAKLMYPSFRYDRETMTNFDVNVSDGRTMLYKNLPHHSDDAFDKAFYAQLGMKNDVDSPCFVGVLQKKRPEVAGWSVVAA